MYLALCNGFSFAKEGRAFPWPAGALRIQTYENEKWKTINVNKALLEPFFLLLFHHFPSPPLMTNDGFTAAIELECLFIYLCIYLFKISPLESKFLSHESKI